MAELEVKKHTKKVFKIWGNKENGFWHKVREFLLEILIIVFAVSLSIWLHGRSEHSHQQKEVKQFLLGLREDLLSDIEEMESDRKSYYVQGQAFKYITSVKPGDSLDNDSLRSYQGWLFNTTRLELNNGRFEGFKASGKIGTIEDNSIQNDIMDIYQENLPSLLASTDFYLRRKHQFFDYHTQNVKKFSDSTTNLATALLHHEAQNISTYLARPDEIISRYDSSIHKMKGLVNKIEEKYKLK